ncbi:MAG: hypothetical protein J7501_03885 [Bdellovibrio sp.]|nr:hypothetical protein [Bdellovibrio sp.]
MEALPVSPLQPKMDPVILKPHLVETLPFVLKGWTRKKIADHFDIKPTGARERLEGIYRAFGVTSRFELYEKATTEGLHYRTSKGPARVYHASLKILELTDIGKLDL